MPPQSNSTNGSQERDHTQTADSVSVAEMIVRRYQRVRVTRAPYHDLVIRSITWTDPHAEILEAAHPPDKVTDDVGGSARIAANKARRPIRKTMPLSLHGCRLAEPPRSQETRRTHRTPYLSWSFLRVRIEGLISQSACRLITRSNRSRDWTGRSFITLVRMTLAIGHGKSVSAPGTAGSGGARQI